MGDDNGELEPRRPNPIERAAGYERIVEVGSGAAVAIAFLAFLAPKLLDLAIVLATHGPLHFWGFVALILAGAIPTGLLGAFIRRLKSMLEGSISRERDLREENRSLMRKDQDERDRE